MVDIVRPVLERRGPLLAKKLSHQQRSKYNQVGFRK